MIGIDGIDGSGKSTLGSAVSEALGLPCISLDSFLEKDPEGYVESMDYTKLKAALEGLKGYVVEGVCLTKVLQRIQLTPEASIYIKRVRYGFWLDETQLDIHEPVEVALARERESASRFSSSPVDNLGLAEEVIRYHAEFCPHDSADITYAASTHY
ncbi:MULTISPECIES: hypothetical protein [unclassified Pseudomonas]